MKNRRKLHFLGIIPIVAFWTGSYGSAERGSVLVRTCSARVLRSGVCDDQWPPRRGQVVRMKPDDDGRKAGVEALERALLAPTPTITPRAAVSLRGCAAYTSPASG